MVGRIVRAGVAVGFVACAAGPEAPRLPREARIELTSSADGAVLAARVYAPSGRPISAPVAVVLHDCTGPTAADAGWSAALARAGWNVVRVNSHASVRKVRGGDACPGDIVVDGSMYAADARSALRAVRDLPGVDTSRAIVLGVGRGADGVLFLARHRPKVGPDFAGGVAIHPWLRSSRALEARFPLVLLGARAAENTKGERLEAAAARSRSRGRDVAAHIYEGAAYGFDNPDWKSARKSGTGQPHSLFNPEATAAARADVKRFLARWTPAEPDP